MALVTPRNWQFDALFYRNPHSVHRNERVKKCERLKWVHLESNSEHGCTNDASSTLHVGTETVSRHRQCCQAKFRRQPKLGPYLLDFFCPDAKLVIECDGLPHFTPVGIKKDRIRSQWLNPVGIEVMRYTSDEIENDTLGVLFAINVVLKRLLKQDAPPQPHLPRTRCTTHIRSTFFRSCAECLAARRAEHLCRGHQPSER